MLFSFMSSCSSLETLRLVLCMAVQKGRREQVEVSYTQVFASNVLYIKFKIQYIRKRQWITDKIK
jgi:hypothetical protein